MWLQEADLPDIKTISLKGKDTNADLLKKWSKFSTLESVSLEDTPCICDPDLQNFVESVPQLNCLEIKSVAISDLGVKYICEHLIHLETLALTKLGLLTNSCVQTISGSLSNLTYLDISECKNMNQHCLKQLNSLAHLCVIKCDFGVEEIDTEVLTELRSGFSGKLIHRGKLV